MKLNLTFLKKIDIKDTAAKFDEPSGLALAHDRDGLWTVSDDTAKIFKLTLEGGLQRKQSFKVPDKGLEGITIDPTGTFLVAVREKGNEIVKLDIAKRDVVARCRLAGMDGFEPLSAFFAGGDQNKGLEGVAWNSDTGSLFVLKEGQPGVLIEVALDLEKILDHTVLDTIDGFASPSRSGKKVDFSDICYDPANRLFWIVSDKARRVFLYEPIARRVVDSVPLGYGDDGEYREVKKAEGVAYDHPAGRLYVASDEEASLYVWDVRL